MNEHETMVEYQQVIADWKSDYDTLLKKLYEKDEKIAELERHNETFKNQITEHEDTWLAICGDISKLEDLMEDDDTWENADKEDLYQFDPWHCLKQSLDFMEKQKRHNELLRAVGEAARQLVKYPPGVYATFSERGWALAQTRNAAQAAIDGGALDKEGEK